VIGFWARGQWTSPPLERTLHLIGAVVLWAPITTALVADLLDLVVHIGMCSLLLFIQSLFVSLLVVWSCLLDEGRAGPGGSCADLRE